MGSESSVQSSAAHGQPGVLATKLGGLAKEQPAGQSSPDITWGTKKTCLGEGDVESQNTDLERSLERQPAGESLPDVAQGTPNNGLGEENVAQTDQWQEEADTLSLAYEAKEAQGLDVDPMTEALPASGVKTVGGCTGDATEEHHIHLNSLEKGQRTGQVHELNVGGQPLGRDVVQKDLSTAQDNVVSRESQTANRKLVCFLLNEADFHTMNVSKESCSVNDVETREPRATTATRQPTTKPPPQVPEQLGCSGGEEPVPVEELAKAIPGDPVLERAGADVAEEQRPQKTTQTVHNVLAVPPVVTQQPKAQMGNAPQRQAFSGGVSGLRQPAVLSVVPEEEGKCRMSLLPEKKKSSCCSLL